MVKSQATRSRIQNRKIARQVLAEKLEVIEKGDESRKRIKEDLKSKRKRSSDKKSRRKYRKLAEGKEGDGDSEPNEEDVVESDELGRSSSEGGTVGDSGSGQKDVPEHANRQSSLESNDEGKLTR